MGPKVLFLPGILGSELWERGAIPILVPDRRIWIDPVQLLGGALNRLELGFDGFTPGPLAGGAVIYPRSPLSQFYGPMGSYLLAQGYDVLFLGYDWRYSIITAGNIVWQAVQPWLGSQPLYVVAHSQGGLVARAVYGLMAGLGLAGQLARLICIGTPHYGAWEANWVWWHLARLYRWLLETIDRWAYPVAYAVQRLIDLIVSGWFSLYELMPWKDYGPLHDADPYLAESLYTIDDYGPGSNPEIRAHPLIQAPVVQGILQGYLPTRQMVGIYGTGERTPYILRRRAPPGRYSSYNYTDQGDGTVTLAQGAVPGVQVYQVATSHELLCQHGLTQSLVRQIISQGPAT
jgi:hypothetical protein